MQLFHYMLRSEAWLTSKPLDRSIYLQIASRFTGENNGRLPYSVREGARECQADKDAVAGAINRLEERGLIECTTDSCFAQKMRRAREWRLTTHACNVTGDAASRAFNKWTAAPATAGSRDAPALSGSTGQQKQMVGPEISAFVSGHAGQVALPSPTLVRLGGTVDPSLDRSSVPSEGTLYISSHRPTVQSTQDGAAEEAIDNDPFGDVGRVDAARTCANIEVEDDRARDHEPEAFDDTARPYIEDFPAVLL